MKSSESIGDDMQYQERYFTSVSGHNNKYTSIQAGVLVTHMQFQYPDHTLIPERLENILKGKQREGTKW